MHSSIAGESIDLTCQSRHFHFHFHFHFNLLLLHFILKVFCLCLHSPNWQLLQLISNAFCSAVACLHLLLIRGGINYCQYLCCTQMYEHKKWLLFKQDFRLFQLGVYIYIYIYICTYVSRVASHRQIDIICSSHTQCVYFVYAK